MWSQLFIEILKFDADDVFVLEDYSKVQMLDKME